jgi:hypothetical protein
VRGEKEKRGKATAAVAIPADSGALWSAAWSSVLAGALDLQGQTAAAVDLRAS